MTHLDFAEHHSTTFSLH